MKRRVKIRTAFLVLIAVAYIASQNLFSSEQGQSMAEELLISKSVVVDQQRKKPVLVLNKEELMAARRKRMDHVFKREKHRDPHLVPHTSNVTTSSTTTIFGQGAKPLKVNYPIFVLNFPKTGTTTLWQYFECGLGDPRQVIHWWTTDRGQRVGPCVEHNIQQQLPPLQQCGNYAVWIDFGYATPTDCFFPAVHGYKALYEAYPQATFLIVPRDVEDWFRSASQWGPMLRKWKTSCRSAFFPDLPANQVVLDEHIQELYLRTIRTIQQFAHEHPGMNLLLPPANITLKSPLLGPWLEETFGISATCWRKCQPTGKTATCEDDPS